ncbi:MAG: copper amine oxidase [Sporomusaceae bacterium]|nr:copper amine oxidase [Sporomusaceae bacterium]
MKKLLVLLSSAVMLLGQSAGFAASAPLPDKVFVDSPEWALTTTQYGGTLLLSDSPETAPADGVLYEDKVHGDVRLFFHHVNGTKEPKKILVLLENHGTKEANINVYRYGFSGPGLAYGLIGKDAQLDYLADRHEAYTVSVPAGGSSLLWEPLQKMTVKPDELVNGIFDFKVDQPITVKTVMVPEKYKQETIKSLKVLPNDETALRGTFAGRDKLLIPNAVYNPPQDGSVVITLADNEVDPYVIGTDATSGRPVMNYGNYGVMYHVFMPSIDGKQTFKGYLNPLGGDYGGALGIKYDFKIQPPVLTPKDQPVFGADTITAAELFGTYQSGKSLWVTFSPPGASNLPIRLLFVPDSLTKALDKK